MKWTCGKCTMSFHVGMAVDTRGNGEWHRCPVDGCGRRFYAGATTDGPVRCSINASTHEDIQRRSERKMVA